MKKLFLILIISLVSLSVQAEGLSGYHKLKEKTKNFLSPTESKPMNLGEVCLDDGTGTLRKTQRPAYDIAFRINLLDTPNGGTMQFKGTENIDLSNGL